MQRRAETTGHELGVRMVFGEAFARESGQIGGPDGEAWVLLGITQFGAGEVRDGGGIDAPGEEAAQRDVRDQLTTHRLAEIVTAGFRGLSVGEGLDLGRVMRRDERTTLRLPVGGPFEI